MKVFDSFMFYNELDLLEIRLELLYKNIDYFVISECNETFSGKKKRFLLHENMSRFSKYKDKIIYQKLESVPKDFRHFKKQYYTDYNKSYSHKHDGKTLLELSTSFQNEVFQRDSLIEPLLKYAENDDIIIMSDLDEIPSIQAISDSIEYLKTNDKLVHLEQKWFMYFFDNFLDSPWYGTHICKFSFLKEYSVDLLQYHKENKDHLSNGLIIPNGGWHFSFLGGAKVIQEKLEAYDYQGGRSAKILAIFDKIFPNRIKRKLKNNEDIFLTNRKFQKVKVGSFFPKELEKILVKYPKHLSSK